MKIHALVAAMQVCALIEGTGAECCGFGVPRNTNDNHLIDHSAANSDRGRPHSIDPIRSRADIARMPQHAVNLGDGSSLISIAVACVDARANFATCSQYRVVARPEVMGERFVGVMLDQRDLLTPGCAFYWGNDQCGIVTGNSPVSTCTSAWESPNAGISFTTVVHFYNPWSALDDMRVRQACERGGKAWWNLDESDARVREARAVFVGSPPYPEVRGGVRNFVYGGSWAK